MINVLEPRVYNRISAGEVVDRPASIVKELVENSIDAKAKAIVIEITDGGIKNITVSDDGCGIEKNDIATAFLPHATSKIKDVEDLDNILSLGFRGEALASISAVCQVKLSSKTKESAVGYSIKVNGGIFDQVVEVARENGTTISCSNLFFNTPVRAKFLRKPKTEEAEITHLIEKFMLSHSDIAFTYYIDGKLVYNTTACSMQDIIYTIYGKEVYDNLVEVNYTSEDITVEGYVTKPKLSKSNRTYQTLFINGRVVENFLVSSAVQSVYEAFLMKGRFPVYVLSIIVPANSVDVNVHPSKKEVRFDNPNKIFSIMRKAVENALLSTDQIANFIFEEENTLPQPNFSKGIYGQHQQTNQDNKYAGFKAEILPSNEGKSYKENEDKSYKDNEEKSYIVDLIDTEVKPASPEEFDIVVKKDEEQKQTNEEFDDLSKMSLKDRYIIESKDNSTFFFDQSGEKFTASIRANTQAEKFLNASVKDEMKILGTLFKTYIVIELQDSVYFIDQHAAHERLLYDKLVSKINENNITTQDLLVPYTFSLGAKESANIDLSLDQLKKMGFVIEKNQYSYKIKSVPLVLADIELEKFVDELIKDSVNWDKKPSDYIHEKLCQTACKHAIKAGDDISKDQCAYIIEQVRKGVMLCPHGRPVTLAISKREFEKMFKRVV